ncbi:hypothetical protein H3N89_gp52 [Microbacterium phage MonChoix]|uniref:Uncharacterized protein n=1 Tax=Microbacterium phage MonChoix TaxID=2590880 RepID=A0A4Y6ED52_9CAUD|nr:hypothetical protein H3N89_gp52 [Microbacterium phage MonChoix]QDF16017.1 hypothetical protein SEA_MONCHOIX_52 [Microbacterium phage MonChoix]
MAKTVLLGVNDNEGYAPDQIRTEVTLADLLAAVQDAITEHGEDAKVVVSNGQRYGAGFGSLEAMPGGEVIISDAAPDQCPECGRDIDEAVYGQCDYCGHEL